ncbi:hypothetical protein ACFQ51_37560 [Streptomyces kaempferi]
MPLDGNGGYTVRRYTLDFDWAAPRTPFGASTTIDATATQALSRFDLDFAGNTLRRVTVDGTPRTPCATATNSSSHPRGPSLTAAPSPCGSTTPPTRHGNVTGATPSRTTAGCPRPTAPCSTRSPTAPR